LSHDLTAKRSVKYGNLLDRDESALDLPKMFKKDLRSYVQFVSRAQSIAVSSPRRVTSSKV